MQTRGSPIVLRHILSYMERTYTKDPDLAILWDRLVEADHIASVAVGGHTQIPLVTPLPHCSNDFPIYVNDMYSDDRLGSRTVMLLDKPPAHLRRTTDTGGPSPGHIMPALRHGIRMPNTLNCGVSPQSTPIHLNIFPVQKTVREVCPLISYNVTFHALS